MILGSIMALLWPGVAHGAPTDLGLWRLSTQKNDLILAGVEGSIRVSCSPTSRIAGRAIASTNGGWSVREQDGGWSASCDARTAHSRWRLALEGRDGSSSVVLDVDIEATATYAPDLEAVDVRLDGSSHTWDRAWRWRPVSGPRVLDRWTPRRVDAPGVTLQSDAQSLVVSADAQTTTVSIQLDNALEHPDVRYRRCATTWSVDLEDQRDERGARRRAVGEVRGARTWLHLGGLPKVAARRWPDARDAALVFTDHADPGSAARLETIAWGSQDNAARPPDTRASRGMLGHGLRWTQTVFTHDHRGYTKQGTDPRFVRRVRELVSAGVDVGPHSPSGGPDSFTVVKDGLLQLDRLASSQTWIDHQPTTNCEALSSSGAVSGSPWSIGSHLDAAGYRYAWATLDVLDRVQDTDIWQVADSVHRPVLYPGPPWVPGGQASWWFTSQWRAITTERLVRAYSAPRLDALQDRHGLHIAHTYLMSRGSGPAGALWRQGSSGLELKPEVEAMFAELGRRQRANTLWVAGLPEVADHLRGVSHVHIDAADSHTLTVQQLGGPTPLTGLTLRLPMNLGWPALDGTPVPAARLQLHPDGLLLIMDLRPGQPRELSFLDRHDRPVQIAAQTVVRRQR